jgi:ComF family protein
MGMQALLHVVFPPQCLTCDSQVATDFGLCSSCWRDTTFIAGPACTKCGIQLLGAEQETVALCDDCFTTNRPWSRGRAAMMYQGNARNLVLALKRGDRLDLAKPAAKWMAAAASTILQPDMLAAPVPLHWLRLFKRRYNQSALLSSEVARVAGIEHCPDLLQRRRSTGSQEGRSREGRFSNMANAVTAHPRHASKIAGRHILLIDDVFTTGATLSAAAAACLENGAREVSVLVMARVAKDD